MKKTMSTTTNTAPSLLDLLMSAELPTTGKKAVKEEKVFDVFSGTHKAIEYDWGKVWQRESNQYEEDGKSRLIVWVDGKKNSVDVDFLKIVSKGAYSVPPAYNKADKNYRHYKMLIDLTKANMESKEYKLICKPTSLAECVPDALHNDLNTISMLQRNQKIVLTVADDFTCVTVRWLKTVPSSK